MIRVCGYSILDQEVFRLVVVQVWKFVDEEQGFLMFTPQKKGWPGWSPSPRVGDGVDNGMTTPVVNTRSGSVLAFLKGKGKGKGNNTAEALPLPLPLQASLGENGDTVVVGGGDAEVWRNFREAGLLDESALQNKDREALVQRILALEKEVTGDTGFIH